jgi:DNA-binding NtrC family response regulator
MTMKVLLVDDQQAVRTALEVLFSLHDIPTLSASTADEVLHIIRTEDVGVVLQDMNFTQSRADGGEGVALFRSIKALDPDVPVLLMTAWASLETAVALVKEGAADYLAKPWDDQKLVRTVQNLLRLRDLEQAATRSRGQRERAKRELSRQYDLRGIVYASESMQAVVSLACHVAPSDAPVLVTGPNGSGKESIAEIVHANSRRKDKPLVKVNIGGLPDDLLEAELFGAEPGAYTGIAKLRLGRFETAHGGTLFLDEIGNLSLSGQARLLRVLQTGEFERLGSSVTRKVDVRVVSATNVDLPAAIAAGRFREDLFFRLNVIELKIPPLGERQEDVLPLAQYFLGKYQKAGVTCRLTPAAETALRLHDWSGNVRELQNRIQRATLVCSGEVVTDVDLGLAGEAIKRGGTALEPEPQAEPERGGPERASIEEALLRAGGVVSKAAAELGMSRQALYRRMERLGISLERRLK